MHKISKVTIAIALCTGNVTAATSDVFQSIENSQKIYAPENSLTAGSHWSVSNERCANSDYCANTEF